MKLTKETIRTIEPEMITEFERYVDEANKNIEEMKKAFGISPEVLRDFQTSSARYLR